ncbi:SDR family NAD(P)-dependent oxidoreductase [Fluoribacter dumoffii]|uniref:3-oxoacyl-[acyl-carrier-protein] reductase FabG n=1 Tax=Fluoribacter dumoffii TaxID=463 RepID=A0A377GAF7_9GAMM|nr:SDR family NAD(P)-dependent oxidoreductase [Fluoribacter dumoffii]KTC90361.1 oxidoreductase with NAD(P)-binding Rossmann-fold domain protein [Fluoribacter dumoffii NY 23]MCW8385678.1 SDR family NAD(P)-dependent oxidoreductase [Fluoribacter dumoffii]MCW8418708.1 SDR family NAD(P)-dependent oxidoreductase [Fluoribacter dumoffii]MCW8453448.1 SDR family NAD(P)-dependent oxidoreductase [Fluoribacter dumoffii]MCW8459332.1 SDR family NAD(P)-dependent oxidoreductase [Fluoribacter dumoffii]
MKEKIILITGCSSGIGFDAVFALKKRGHRVIGSCRKQEDVQKLIDMGIEAVQLDVADSASIQNAFSDVLSKTNGRLDVLINNAGYGQIGALEDISREVLREQFETNVFGLVELTNLAIPVMRKQGYGRIINLSSILGVISMPFRGAYNASKYAVEGISDTLRLELKSSGIDVITIEPGPIESRFRDNCVDNSLDRINRQNSYFSKQYEGMLMSFKEKKSDSVFTLKPDAVINKFIHAIESKKPKVKYPVTFPAHFLIFLKWILSAKMLDRFILLVSKKELS